MKTIVANKQYNKELCKLSKSISMPGNIQLAFGRDRDFFTGLNIQGKYNQVIASLNNNGLIGFGCRSIRPVFLNGKERLFGYLSGLKSYKKYHGSLALIKGYNFFKELHKDGKTKGYITTIIDSNTYAKILLESGRAGLPKYIDFGRYYTYAINLNRRKKYKIESNGIKIIKGDKIPLKDIIDFINKQGKNKQFSSVYKKTDFGTDYLRDFNISDFYIAVFNREIIGTIGVWDQSRYKQNIVTGYSGILKYLRKSINYLISILGYKKLPDQGNSIKMFYTFCVFIKNNDKNILNLLTEKIYNDRKNEDYHYFIFGFHERDSLRRALNKYYKFTYISKLYLVLWKNDLDFFKYIDKEMVPHIEVATL